MSSIIDFEAAIDIAKRVILQRHRRDARLVEVDLRRVIASTSGWVFQYNTPAYNSTRNMADAALGLAPFLVLRDGSVVEFMSGRAIEDQLAEYEQRST